MSNSTILQEAPVPKAILLLVGPLLTGALMSFLLFGISIVQLYIYNLKYSHDKFWVQFSVYMIFILDIFQSASVWTLAWHSLASGWGRSEALIFPGWTFSALVAVTGIIAAWVQIFYAWRIHAMANWRIIPIFIVLLALTQASVTFSMAITFMSIKSILLLHSSFTTRTIIWLGSAALADVIISVSMVYLFHTAKKNALKRTEKMLNRLIRSTVETGIVTTLFATLELICFLAFPDTDIHATFALMLSKVYSNELMTSLNSRLLIRSEGSKDEGTWTNGGDASLSLSRSLKNCDAPMSVIHVSTDLESVFDRNTGTKHVE